MPYIGTGVPNRALTSADIAQGAVTLDDISFTDQPTNLNILGTIDKHTMRLTDGVTVTGDVTLSDNLIFSKLSDDGNAITLTDDGSTRTITGTGSIEASTLAQTPNSSLTGMTGELGSGVTLGSGVVFPKGYMRHIINVAPQNITGINSTGVIANAKISTGTFTAGSKILISVQGWIYKNDNRTDATNYANCEIFTDTTSSGTASHGGANYMILERIGLGEANRYYLLSCNHVFITTNNITSATYQLYHTDGGQSASFNYNSLEMNLYEIY